MQSVIALIIAILITVISATMKNIYHKLTRELLVIALALLLTPLHSWAMGEYEIIDLTLPGDTVSYVDDINNFSQVIFRSGSSTSVNYYLWENGGIENGQVKGLVTDLSSLVPASLGSFFTYPIPAAEITDRFACDYRMDFKYRGSGAGAAAINDSGFIVGYATVFVEHTQFNCNCVGLTSEQCSSFRSTLPRKWEDTNPVSVPILWANKKVSSLIPYFMYGDRKVFAFGGYNEAHTTINNNGTVYGEFSGTPYILDLHKTLKGTESNWYQLCYEDPEGLHICNYRNIYPYNSSIHIDDLNDNRQGVWGDEIYQLTEKTICLDPLTWMGMNRCVEYVTLLKDMNPPPGYGNSVYTDGSINGINDNGNAAGYYYNELKRNYHAFLYADGTLNDLGTIPSDTSNYYSSFGQDINNKDEVVGYSNKSSGPRAFLWLPQPAYNLSPGMYKLQDIVPANSSWTLKYAKLINDDGVIAGEGRINHEDHAFLAKPAGYILPTGANYEYSGQDHDPVNTFTGELLIEEKPDLDLGGPMSLRFSRHYTSGMKKFFKSKGVVSAMGDSWRHNFEWHLFNGSGMATIVTDSGQFLEFDFVDPNWVSKGNNGSSGQYHLTHVGDFFKLTDKAGDILYTFGLSGNLISIESGKGGRLTLGYNTDDRLSSVADGMGRMLTFGYDQNGNVTSVSDGTRMVTFTYVVGPDYTYLNTYTDPHSNRTVYTTFAEGLITDVTHPEGNTPYTQVYNSDYTVGRQTDAFGNMVTFQYYKHAGQTKITEPAGIKIHTHSANGQMLKSQDASGSQLFTYDSIMGRRLSATDKLGNATSYQYHLASGKASSVTYPDGSVITNDYTLRVRNWIPYYDLTATHFPDGTSLGFTFDGKGNITTFTNRGAKTTAYTYNDISQPLTITNPAGGVTTYTYNTDGTIASLTDSAGNTTVYGYDSLLRRNLITNPDGTSHTYIYDDLNRVTETVDEQGNHTYFTYDKNSNLTSTKDRLGNVTLNTYDRMDRFTSSTDPLGNVSSVTYDASGRIISQTSRNGFTAGYEYDAVGNRTATIDPAGITWRTGYNNNGWLTSTTDPLSNTATFDYDSMGRIIRITSPMNLKTEFTYDSMGRKVTETDPLGHITTLSYDGAGNIAGITLPGGIISSYTMNSLDLVTTVKDPNNNLWRYNYDAQGRLLSQSDPLGNTTAQGFDSLNRTSTITLPGSMGTVDIAYDANGNITRQSYSDGTTFNLSYNAEDRLTGTNGVTFTYDANENIVNSNGIGIGMDAGGRITSVTVASGKIITYSYDSRDNLVQVNDWLGGVTTFAYDDAGRLITTTMPDGIITRHSYDADNNLISISEENSTSTISSITLTRNAIGNITSAVRNLPLSTEFPGITNSMSYDAAAQVEGFTYDAMGRLLNDGRRTYNWDLASRLTSYNDGVNIVSFSYDGLGSIITRSKGGVPHTFAWNYAFDRPSLTAIRHNGSDVRYFIHTQDGELLYSIDAVTSGRRFYHFDEMGSVLFCTDDNGVITDRYAYTPYGDMAGVWGNSDNLFTYNGKYGVMQEGTSGLYRMGRRLYDANTKRFISRDPITDQSDPRLINPYRYAAGNPLRYIDPTGEKEERAGTASSPIPGEVKTARTAADNARKILGKAVDTAISRHSNVADAAGYFNGANKKLGNTNSAWIDSALQHSKDLNSYKNILGKAETSLKGLNLVLNAAEKGPAGVANFTLEEAGKKYLGKQTVGVIKIGMEAFNTNERVNAVQNERRMNIKSAGDSYDNIMKHLKRAYFVDKTITIGQFETLAKNAGEAYMESLDGAQASGMAGIGIESLQGLQNMLQALTGM